MTFCQSERTLFKCSLAFNYNKKKRTARWSHLGRGENGIIKQSSAHLSTSVMCVWPIKRRRRKKKKSQSAVGFIYKYVYTPYSISLVFSSLFLSTVLTRFFSYLQQQPNVLNITMQPLMYSEIILALTILSIPVFISVRGKEACCYCVWNPVGCYESICLLAPE